VIESLSDRLVLPPAFSIQLIDSLQQGQVRRQRQGKVIACQQALGRLAQNAKMSRAKKETRWDGLGRRHRSDACGRFDFVSTHSQASLQRFDFNDDRSSTTLGDSAQGERGKDSTLLVSVVKGERQRVIDAWASSGGVGEVSRYRNGFTKEKPEQIKIMNTHGTQQPAAGQLRLGVPSLQTTQGTMYVDIETVQLPRCDLVLQPQAVWVGSLIEHDAERSCKALRRSDQRLRIVGRAASRLLAKYRRTGLQRLEREFAMGVMWRGDDDRIGFGGGQGVSKTREHRRGSLGFCLIARNESTQFGILDEIECGCMTPTHSAMADDQPAQRPFGRNHFLWRSRFLSCHRQIEIDRQVSVRYLVCRAYQSRRGVRG
jgi:hypothetical protein